MSHSTTTVEQPTGRNLAFTGQTFRVQRKVNLIGRGKDCTLTIIDPSVSRIHTKLSVERSGTLMVEDLKSSNGTFLNDERIEVATLHHRDVIRFGNVDPWLFTNHPMRNPQAPEAYVWSLGLLYLVFAIAVAILYFPCRWFAGLKARSRTAWLSYL